MWIRDLIKSKGYTPYSFYQKFGSEFGISMQMFFYNCRKNTALSPFLHRLRLCLGMSIDEFYNLCESSQPQTHVTSRKGRKKKQV